MSDSILKLKPYISPAAWIVAFQVVGGLIGAVTVKGIDGWYDGLAKSVLNPPDYAFGIVWPILYVMIALAGFYSWRVREEPGGRAVFGLFCLYTALNWGWSFVFFTAHLVLPGFIWILIMNIVTIIFIVKAWKIAPRAARLMILPLLWASFASYLSYMIWVLN